MSLCGEVSVFLSRETLLATEKQKHTHTQTLLASPQRQIYGSVHVNKPNNGRRLQDYKMAPGTGRYCCVVWSCGTSSTAQTSHHSTTRDRDTRLRHADAQSLSLTDTQTDRQTGSFYSSQKLHQTDSNVIWGGEEIGFEGFLGALCHSGGSYRATQTLYHTDRPTTSWAGLDCLGLY